MADVSDALRVVVGRCNARRSHFPANLPPHPCSFYMDCADWDLMHAALAQALENDARYRFLKDAGIIRVYPMASGMMSRGGSRILADTKDWLPGDFTYVIDGKTEDVDAAIDSAIAAQQKEADGG